jgi:DNA polymerase sigma
MFLLGNGGTLSTYAWTCMILNFLQMRQPPILPTLHEQTGVKPPTWFNDDLSSLRGFGKANNESVAGLLYAFFRHFAVEFDYSHHVMSLRHGTYLDKHSKGWDFGRNYRMLCIEEPFDTSRNLGNSVDDISVFGLRKEFQRGVASLYEQCNLALLCEPYKFCHIIQPVGDSARVDESSPTSDTSDSSHSLQAPVWVKSEQPPSIRSIIEPENHFHPPIRKIDLDTIHTDTVARVKLPRHRPVVKTFP